MPAKRSLQIPAITAFLRHSVPHIQMTSKDRPPLSGQPKTWIFLLQQSRYRNRRKLSERNTCAVPQTQSNSRALLCRHRHSASSSKLVALTAEDDAVQCFNSSTQQTVTIQRHRMRKRENGPEIASGPDVTFRKASPSSPGRNGVADCLQNCSGKIEKHHLKNYPPSGVLFLSRTTQSPERQSVMVTITNRKWGGASLTY